MATGIGLAAWSRDGERLYAVTSDADGATMLSAGHVAGARVRFDRALTGQVEAGYPYDGLDVGPCLPGGLPPVDRAIGPDRPLDGTDWRFGASHLRFEPPLGCEATTCDRRSVTVVSGDPDGLTATASISATTISVEEAADVDAGNCLPESCFLAGPSATYEIRGPELHISQPGHDEITYVASDAAGG